jgi:hypothetical protein
MVLEKVDRPERLATRVGQSILQVVLGMFVALSILTISVIQSPDDVRAVLTALAKRSLIQPIDAARLSAEDASI